MPSDIRGAGSAATAQFVFVETEEACNLKTDLQAEIDEQTGWYFPLRIYPIDEKENLVLPDEEVVPI